MDAMPAGGDGQAPAVLPARVPAAGLMRRLLVRLLVLAGAIIGCWLLGALLGSSRASAAPAAPGAPVVHGIVTDVAARAETGQPPLALPLVRSTVQSVPAGPVQNRVPPMRRPGQAQLARAVSRLETGLGRTVDRVAPVPVPIPVPVAVRLPVAVAHLPASTSALITAAHAAEAARASNTAPGERFTSRPVRAVNDSRAGWFAASEQSVRAHVEWRAGRSHPPVPSSPPPTQPGRDQPFPGIAGDPPNSTGSANGSGVAAADRAGSLVMARPVSSRRLADLSAAARAAALPEPSVSPD